MWVQKAKKWEHDFVIPTLTEQFGLQDSTLKNVYLTYIKSLFDKK